MAPELIDPEGFGLERCCPTKRSDCYAFGMVVYEVISGHPPFHKHTDLTVFKKVLEGKRPPRVVGFAESLWGMLELCWEPQPGARPKIDYVLQCLERLSNSSNPPSPGVDEETEDSDDFDSTNNSSGKCSRLIPPPRRVSWPLFTVWTQGHRHPLKRIHIILGLHATPASVIHRPRRTRWILYQGFCHLPRRVL